MQELLGFITVMIVLAAGLIIYFLPLYIAYQRAHRQLAAIAILNLLLGWSVLGWVVSLVWALIAEKE